MSDNSIAKHTPGPWFARFHGDGAFDIEDKDPREGCNLSSVLCSRYTWREKAVEMKANARLMAASPDLLAALQTFVKYLADTDEEGLIEHVEPMIAARAAIAKATGGAA